MRTLLTMVVLAAAPLAWAGMLDLDLTSSQADNIAGETGFVTDSILGVEVAQHAGLDGWVWPAFEVYFPAMSLEANAELQILGRYHQADNPLSDPPRTAYTDANFWALIADANGISWDLGWSATPWTEDAWLTQTYSLAGPAPEGFDTTAVTTIIIRSTDWSGVPEEDYINVANVTITPEPASLSLLALGLLGVIRRR